MKLEYIDINEIKPVYKHSTILLEVDGYVEPTDLVLTALEYLGLNKVIETLIQENFDNAPKIEEIVKNWYKRNEKLY